MIKLEHLVKKIEDLPPLPEIVVKLLKASRDPNVSMREMVELIKHDPALTIKVLRLCNSSYYGLPRKINSIQEALVYIGTDTLVNFVLAGCLSTFYQQAQTGYGLEKGELWRHSVGCAQEIQNTFRNIFSEGLPGAGLAIRPAPTLELYDERFKGPSGDSEFDILIPVN